ncbi:MAG: HAD family hydrolase [Parascardovia denticolens]
MTYSYALFDLYGTLVDIRTDEGDPGLWKDFHRYLADRLTGWPGGHAKPPALASASALEEDLKMRQGEELACREASDPSAAPEEIEIDLEPVYRKTLADFGFDLGLGYDEREIHSLISDAAVFFRRRSRSRLEVFPQAVDLLARLRQEGVMTVLASNAQLLFTEQELEPLRDSFDRIFISSQVGFKKPSPRFFGRILDSLPLSENGPDGFESDQERSGSGSDRLENGPELPENRSDRLGSGPGRRETASRAIAARRAVMVGNEVGCDILGARGAGVDGILLRTGTIPELSREEGSSRAVLCLDGADYPAVFEFITGKSW